MSMTIVNSLLNSAANGLDGLTLPASIPAPSTRYFGADVVGQTMSPRLPAGWRPASVRRAGPRALPDEAALFFAMKPLLPGVALAQKAALAKG
jgi:hypothetical protein